jgi:hypothetical protein
MLQWRRYVWLAEVRSMASKPLRDAEAVQGGNPETASAAESIGRHGEAAAASDVKPHVAFAQPAENSNVHLTQTVSGHVSGVPAGWQLWLVVYASAANVYYPRVPGPLAVRNGRFTTDVTFAPSVGTYELQLVLADPAGSRRLREYQVASLATTSPPG